MKIDKECVFCKTVFNSYQSQNKKFCSHECAWKSYLKSPSTKIGHSDAERQIRYRKLNRIKFYNECECGKEKYKTSLKCVKCSYLSRSGEKSPYFKGGYENHLWHCRRRHALKLGANGSHTLEQWQDLKKKYNYMCLCCKSFEPFITLSEDHIIPLSKGGNDDIINIQPLCRNCNSRKYNKIINFIESLEKIIVTEN